MSLQIWIWIIVGLTFALYIGIAIWSKAGSTKEFYIAGKGVNPIANGMATAADWMSAASFISMAGIISFTGYDGSVYLMGWTGGYVLLALLLAPYLRKFGKFTVPDFIGDRYYSNVARTVAVFCALIVSFTYIAGQMRGVGIVFSRYLEVDINTGVFIGMGIVLFYAILGGMKGITYTQVAQYCVLIFAFMVPAIFISIQMTGNPIPQLGFGSESADGVYLLDKLNGLHEELGFSEYTSGSKSTLDVFLITAALMIGTAGLPHVIVRFFTVKKVSDARKSAGWALLFIAILYTTAPAIAVFARTNLIETVSEKDYSDMPNWFKKWEDTGLLKFDDKNEDNIIQYVGDEQLNELTIDKDIMVLANPEIAQLPNWVIALLAAGAIAAALSTAAGLLLVISSSISHDLIKRIINPTISDKGELIAARTSAFFAVLLAGYFGINPPDFVAATVALAFGLAAASFFPAIVLGIFYKKMNKEGAISGMLVGILSMLFYMTKFKFGWFGGGSAEDWWFGISPEGFGTVAMLINFAVSITVSNFTSPPPEKIIKLVENIRLPSDDDL
ncbi:MAG: cation acetate symporter [Flavobacteriaceae bacterium TMED238]|nr:cation acetate symporter [Flavobacteriales bacterium]RPG62776.1 MAG: cation acetate symporter [Flavobacteriaceae bacterium TMED238]|tara:strand:- start:231 stop:1907 length:1677 start_codon:yes stop_codon:yes gene_type:complete